ncbi:MAG TPA: hypothetical protein VFY10_02275 [Dehalococcoidia bacterium]|nr:hypothetical protein [Dehalococcoidia bacterium]
MIMVRRGVSLFVDVASACMWGLAAFFVGARLLSPAIGLALALAVFVSAMTMVMGSRQEEAQARELAAGACPRCHKSLSVEHDHRRWDATFEKWLPPLTTWSCRGCGFEHGEPLPCPSCPLVDA